jgi:hypothetical protein
MDNITTSLVTVALAIVSVATVSVLVSKNANTSQVITSSGNAFANSLLAAISPVTGNAPNLSSL